MATTIGETTQQLHRALSDYIEATYHVSHPLLVQQRARLLKEVGVIHQRPYMESTPRYKSGDPFAQLGLHQSCLELLATVSQATGDHPQLIHDPPYQHQAAALRESLVNGRSLVVMTGTGSGKTECFLLPILGKLAIEASQRGGSFRDNSAVRAIVLYPMNALVNDQLGRLRLLLGDSRIVEKFVQWSGRPARFARYTSRTLYPGVRQEDKDQARLTPIGKYYVRQLEAASGPPSPEQSAAQALVGELKKRGKWPAKPDLLGWYYGEKRKPGGRWRDSKTSQFKRCITLPLDPELLTRHEVHEAPPDVLVTNYSMLEYMLMRPLERPIFDRTRAWLEQNKHEKLLLVIDEAHLYRGAPGAEVALLIRRLRVRLGIPAERLQVICTSASFKDAEYAARFGAELTGKNEQEFVSIRGDLFLRKPEGDGSKEDAEQLAAIDLTSFYEAESDQTRTTKIATFLEYRGVKQPWDLQRSLYEALFKFPPMAKLINNTMTAAQPVDALGQVIFPNTDPAIAASAVTVLLAFGSLARPEPTQPGLLPCRVHSFYRGLAGLWVCMDPQCTAISKEERGGPGGKLYGQPRETCECGARVLELFTCRNCGTAYARAYTDDISEPDFLWSEPGRAFTTHSGDVEELEPIDLLLERPVVALDVEPAGYDLITGRLNPRETSKTRTRQVFIRPSRMPHPQDDGDVKCGLGQFRPCAVCGESATFGRSSVQDHQTKGDQPFQALISKQIQIQPPGLLPATRLAPLRGRKVLVFSDSRQTAARLAPNLQSYSTQDAMRPLIVSGYSQLKGIAFLAQLLCIEDLYLAVLIAAKNLGVRLRPELKVGETFHVEPLVETAIRSGALTDQAAMLQLFVELRAAKPPESLLRAIANCLNDRYYGLESLGIASLIERADLTSKLTALPALQNVATSDDEKVALARVWLRCWAKYGFWLNHMPPNWWRNKEVRPHTGKFRQLADYLPKKIRAQFDKEWLPKLLTCFAEPVDGKFRLKGGALSLSIGQSWAYCQSCRTTQRPFPGRITCLNCGQETATEINPDTDRVFVARKGYYRASTLDALRVPPIAPMALIAAEHTAQLNSAQAQEVYSKAEENELLFQDVDLGPSDDGLERAAIDVLSCTTTMEVGIDIGTLSGVSLRNMPPGRANYQQRAGRAGRRGNAVATVTAFGSADSHDEHYFTHPDQMIRGNVIDPSLTLGNKEIVRRHLTAYLLQRYHQARLPAIKPEDQPHLFAVLGSVRAFNDPKNVLNRTDFELWLRESEKSLRVEADTWLPAQLTQADRRQLLDGLVSVTLSAVNEAIEYLPDETEKPPRNHGNHETEIETGPEVQEEEEEERPGKDPMAETLLDRLLYKGVLPRYAFPTDVATFHVFGANSTRFRPTFQFTPSQGLSVALSQYAPGKEVWIGNKLWTSGAIYSPIGTDRFKAWEKRRYYYECSKCHYAMTEFLGKESRGQRKDCPACGGAGMLGPGTYWMRPPGFAHAVFKEEGTSPDDPPARSYATRAKLTTSIPSDHANWLRLNKQLRIYHTREHLLVTNRGPKEAGYTYCTACGLIEPTANPKGTVGTAHLKPYPDPRNPNCRGGGTTTGLVLGTDFITDVLLISLSIKEPLKLQPGFLATDVALRTLSEALTKAACDKLELEANELQAEYRPALTEGGRSGKEADIYVYDTLPGGAGFAQRAGELGLEIFKRALDILERCPENCDRSCYRCLRNYKNKFEHSLLDRHLGASLLRFLIEGTPPTLDTARLEQSTDILCEDIQRMGVSGLKVLRNHEVPAAPGKSAIAPIFVVNGKGDKFVVGLHGPLTPSHPSTDSLRKLQDYTSVILIDELVVRRNLPAATGQVMDSIS